MDIKPYIILPTLIKQPTWGGSYIVEHKQLTDKKLLNQKIGQSFELSKDSKLSTKHSTEYQPSVEVAEPEDPTKTELIVGKDQPFSLQQLIDQDPQAVLGSQGLEVMGKAMQVLVKMNQAKGNSFQVHVKQNAPLNHWLPKPESWYFFEPGLVTLGLKTAANITDYKNACQLIDQTAQDLSHKVQQDVLALPEAKTQLAELIAVNNPYDYVNLLQVGKDQAIDLSGCGIHHSWEENQQTHPLGNVVYEVQKNVYDPDCTIRSFDKGKIKEDGSIRPVHVEDYFKALDNTPEANDPQKLFLKPRILKKSSTQTIKQIFDTTDYKLQKLTFSGPVTNLFTQTNNSFHHLFVKKGNLKLTVAEQTWTITQGFSILIPASVGQYNLKPFKQKVVTVLKTYV